MLTPNDTKFASIVNDRTIVINFRKNKAQESTQAGQARAMGVRHTERDGKAINVYHVKSVAKKMWVASTDELTPEQTTEMVTSVLEQ